MTRIFINYRRDDAAGAAGRLYDHLAKSVPRGDLFMDADAMKPGIDFVSQLEEQVSKCDVLLAVIGKGWLRPGSSGSSRLQEPDDFVRTEIAAALRRGIPVIPVLVDGAALPQEDSLPDDLKPLVRRHAMELRHTRFAADAEAIVTAVADKNRKRPVRVLLGIAVLLAALAPVGLIVWRSNMFHATPSMPAVTVAADAPAVANVAANKAAAGPPKIPHLAFEKSQRPATIQELSVKLGATYDEVRRAYPEATDLLHGDLSLPSDGIMMFFSKDTRILNNIRADAPFIGAVHGVHINDSFDQVVSRLGQPSYMREPSYLYRIDGNLVRFDVDASGKVVSIFQLLEKPAR